MTKRACKRMVREGAFAEGDYDDGKIRRLPLDRGWSPLGPAHNDDREQGYLKTIKAKSPGQTKLMEAIDARNLVLALGPAGTGKTYLAIAKAVEALEAGRVGRIVLSRPAIEAGESIGFLPGDMEDKLAPYLRPLYDALSDRLSMKRVRALMAEGAIEIAPVGYMRGRTRSSRTSCPASPASATSPRAWRRCPASRWSASTTAISCAIRWSAKCWRCSRPGGRPPRGCLLAR